MNRLRYSTLLLLVASLGFLLVPQQSHAQIGVVGGLNFESLDDLSSESASANFESSTGYHVGLAFNRDFAVLGLRLGAIYRRVGEYRFEDFDDAGDLLDSESFSLSTIELPLDLKYRFTLPLVTPYAMAGPQVSFPIGENDLGDGLEDVTLSGNIGAGVEFNLAGLRLTPELRYEFGVTSLVEDEFEILGTSIQPSESPNLSAFSVRLHVFF
ncbi:MAG: porin family protein [Longimonas sp.]|uniref:porin family protein n=1 Tax=Longimonas sp. TaxID=2039626 RepID=UPI003356D179